MHMCLYFNQLTPTLSPVARVQVLTRMPGGMVAAGRVLFWSRGDAEQRPAESGRVVAPRLGGGAGGSDVVGVWGDGGGDAGGAIHLRHRQWREREVFRRQRRERQQHAAPG